MDCINIFSNKQNRNLTIRLSYLFIALMLSMHFNASADHFSPVWGNQNPQRWMNVIITSAAIDGLNAVAGDEIACYDISPTTGEEICVGYVLLTSDTGPFVINAGKDAGYGGFSEGNEIFFRLWDADESLEITIVSADFNLTPPFVDEYTESGLASASIVSHSINVWQGNNSYDWNTSGNWNTGILPKYNSNVLIPATGVSTYPELKNTSQGTCNNITLEASTIACATILGNEYLTVNGTADIQSHITADKWHIVSKPVNGLDVGFYSLGENPTVYLSEYSETSETYDYLTNPSLPLNNMQGYFLWVCDTNHTYSYSGTLNTGTFGEADNLTRNSSGSGNEGWNLVGNPYPSAIDWEAASGWTKSANIGGAIYLYNEGAWEYYLDDSPSGHSENGSRYIAPGQGFFVRLLSESSGTLIMNDEVRVNEPTDFFKSGDVASYLKLTASGNGIVDQTFIRFIDKSSNSFDGEYDVFKKFNNNEAYPHIFSNTDENYYINSLPFAEQLTVSFTAGMDGEYILSIPEMENIGNLWLEDLLTGASIDIINKDYSFDFHINDNPDRFVIHFTPVSINQFEEESILVYAYDNTICVQSQNLVSGQISIYNLLGQEILQSMLTGATEKIEISEHGYYIVSVRSQGKSIRQKVFIR